MHPTAARDDCQPRISFLTLPREIRDLVYDYRFNTPLTIVIWCSIQPDHPQRRWRVRGALQKTEEGKTVVSDAQDQLRILRCNTVVAREAARTFYSKNKFNFERGWTWDLVVCWLESIGPGNRSFLSKLELDIPSNSHGWQISHYVSSDFARYSTRAALSRNSQLLGLMPVNTNIQPVFDKFFKLLSSGDYSDGTSDLTIDMLLEGGLLPQCRLGPNDRHPRGEHFSMDVPNAIERHRALWASSMGRRLDIRWHGLVWTPAFSEHRADIEAKWVILSVVEEDRVQTWDSELPSIPFSRFVLRRKDIVEEFIGSLPALLEST